MMDKYFSYAERFDRDYDFRVSYELVNQLENETIIHQGVRPDFCFEEEHSKQNYMIWPEFEDDDGEILLDTNSPVETTGTARMWIFLDETREALKPRIKPGEKGYLVFGARIVAKLEIISLGASLS